MFNALKKTSTEKWNIRDNGNYVIPYTITGHYDRRELANIRKAMSRIEANTCIRFRERTRERDYIEIQNQAGQGCYTNVGRIGGRGIVMLESNYRETCTEPETVIHELLHVTGLWHEHMRYDRDQYIKVHYENIDRGYWSQFEKVKPWEATTYNIPYDYKSIMHYEKSAFAYEGKISMETLDPRYQNVIGRQKDASPSDYRKVCEIYQCSQCMNGNTDIDVQKPDPVTVKPFPSTKRG
ncbi:astacin [Oesophagostomum dentatum]|uniref:Metalloendopeptidase n=1 Tax=Oesophagostomum dentatum TaxID=61180 RepID=A0A0B1TBN5_OESDE|nr:astacin [Oesophagostomum dentatum]